jgi:hypothetical protein
VHDYFEILGVSRDACASDIRRACRHSRPSHPDFRDSEFARPTAVAAPRFTAGDAGAFRSPAAADAAIDFIDVTCLIDRMRDAFFRDPDFSKS